MTSVLLLLVFFCISTTHTHQTYTFPLPLSLSSQTTFGERSANDFVDEEVLEAGLLDEGVEGGHCGGPHISLAVGQSRHDGRQQLRDLDDQV